jgi:hypothetical protein
VAGGWEAGGRWAHGAEHGDPREETEREREREREREVPSEVGLADESMASVVYTCPIRL